jgi:uncharacterized LabA/DUF88 family protein
MLDKSFLRIGVFYDGSYFTYAQNYFYGKRKLGWLCFPPLHILIENTLRDKEQGFSNYKVVYAGWYQGLFQANQATEHNLKLDRKRHHDLMHAGIEPKYVPMSQGRDKEKGIDIAMAVDVLQVGLEGKIDVAALVTGDGDFVPLVRALMKHGIRVMAVFFEYEEDEKKSFINPRLLNACNYFLNVNDLEKDKRNSAMFKGLFRQAEK